MKATIKKQMFQDYYQQYCNVKHLVIIQVCYKFHPPPPFPIPAPNFGILRLETQVSDLNLVYPVGRPKSHQC